MYGGYMVDVWQMYNGYMVDLWLCDGILMVPLVDVWWLYGNFYGVSMVDTRYGRCMVVIWYISGNCMVFSMVDVWQPNLHI